MKYNHLSIICIFNIVLRTNTVKFIQIKENVYNIERMSNNRDQIVPIIRRFFDNFHRQLFSCENMIENQAK